MKTVCDLMSKTVQTIHRDTIVSELEGIFVTHEISGAPIVDDSDHMVGFVSKTDIVRFDATGDDPFYARAHEIASPKVIKIGSSASIEEAAQMMLNEHVHHLVVMDGETIAGVLSTLDYVKLVAGNVSEG